MLPLSTATALTLAHESDLREQAVHAKQAKLARRNRRRDLSTSPASRWRHRPKLRTV